jgi:CBS domain-containing protein
MKYAVCSKVEWSTGARAHATAEAVLASSEGHWMSRVAGTKPAPRGAMNVGEVCTRQVATMNPEAPLVEAVRRMRDEHIGSLVLVTLEDGRPVPIGVLTDRDIVVGVLATDLEHLRRLDVGEVATNELVTATEDEDLHTVLRRMRMFGVRRVPIVDDFGALVGLLSLDDLLDAMAEDVAEMAKLVREQPALERERRPVGIGEVDLSR